MRALARTHSSVPGTGVAEHAHLEIRLADRRPDGLRLRRGSGHGFGVRPGAGGRRTGGRTDHEPGDQPGHEPQPGRHDNAVAERPDGPGYPDAPDHPARTSAGTDRPKCTNAAYSSRAATDPHRAGTDRTDRTDATYSGRAA